MPKLSNKWTQEHRRRPNEANRIYSILGYLNVASFPTCATWILNSPNFSPGELLFLLFLSHLCLRVFVFFFSIIVFYLACVIFVDLFLFYNHNDLCQLFQSYPLRLSVISLHVLADFQEKYGENLVEMYVHSREVEEIKIKHNKISRGIVDHDEDVD